MQYQQRKKNSLVALDELEDIEKQLKQTGIQFGYSYRQTPKKVTKLIIELKLLQSSLGQNSKEKNQDCLRVIDNYNKKCEKAYEAVLKKNQEYQVELETIRIQLKNLKEAIKTSQEDKNIKKQLEKYKTENTKIREDIQLLQTKLRQEKQKNKNASPFSASGDLFLGEIIEEENDYYSFIVSIFKNIFSKTIHSAKILFRYDPINKTNFHRYFDDQPNILLIVKTKIGMLLGAFTADQFSKTIRPSQMGIIFSLTNRKVFKSNQKPIVYDDQIMIFGNSELRITTNANTVYSNIGVNSGYYEWRGSADVLLGQGSKREVELEKYQILQLTFAE